MFNCDLKWPMEKNVCVTTAHDPSAFKDASVVTHTVLSMWLSQQRESVTVIWTAETRCIPDVCTAAHSNISAELR